MRARVEAEKAADRERGETARAKLQKQLIRFNAVAESLHNAVPAGGPRVSAPPETATPRAFPIAGSVDDAPPPPDHEWMPNAPRGSARHEARRKQAERDAKRRAKFVDMCTAKGIPLDAVPPDTPAHVYRQTQAILADWSGKLTARALVREARARSGYPIAQLRNAVGGDAADFRDYDTRFVVAVALLLLSVAKRAKRKGRWTMLVAGYSIANMAACCHRPGDPSAVMHRNAFGGGGRKSPAQREASYKARRARAVERGCWSTRARRWDGERTTRESKYEPVLRRLRDAGFLYAQQLPGECVKAWERDSRNPRHVRNRYWLACVSFPELKRQRRGMPSKLGGELLGMLQAEFQKLNAEGWAWIEARLPKPKPPP